MNADDILQAIRDGLKQELSTGYATIKGFVESQGKLLAGQAELIATQRIAGSLKDNDDLYKFFLEGREVQHGEFGESGGHADRLDDRARWNANRQCLVEWSAHNSYGRGGAFPGPCSRNPAALWAPRREIGGAAT